MNTLLMEPTTTPDDALCRASRGGDRDAFAQIVSRYQSLICALAYSRTGNLASSQDLAQDTFVTAWRQIAELHEPAKLRSWLSGIVRNLAANAARVERRRGGPPARLDAIDEPVSSASDPEALSVTHEEEALLWRALSTLPETFREPLVLFYREEQSIAEVAAQLELSVDAVKQRLSRGRAMLRDELTATIESALTRSRPRGAFTTAVIGAIALASPSPAAAAIGAAAAGSATLAGKGAIGMSAAPVVGAAAGLTTAWVAAKAVGLNARSEPERDAIGRSFRRAMLFTLPAVAALVALVVFGRGALQASPWLLIGATTGWTVGLLAVLLTLATRGEREIARIRVETGTTDAEYAPILAARGLRPAGSRRFVSERTLLGLPLFAYGSVGLDIGAPASRLVRAWIAIGDFAVSPLLAVGGLAIAPIAIGGVTVGVLSLSLGGLSVGLLAAGSLAAGWWAFGGAAVGWRAAAGGVAIAHDYAIGGLTRAAEAGTPEAFAWFGQQWFVAPIALFFVSLPVVVLLAIAVPIAVLLRRAWRLRGSYRTPPPNEARPAPIDPTAPNPDRRRRQR
jgi:RNA polymerase sigma factor (sigma-70 family)